MLKTMLQNSKGPEFLKDIMDYAMHLLEHQGGLSQEKSGELAIALTRQIAECYGGARVYIARGTWNGGKLIWFELSERNRNIKRDYDGRNWREMMAKYRVSRARLFQILGQVEAAGGGG